MVLSSNNTYEKVTHLLKRVYTGKVLDINVSGLKINGITDNHKLNIARFKKNKHGRIIINDYEIMEIPASELLISDYVIYQNQMGFSKDKVVLEKTHNRKSKELLIDSNFIKFISWRVFVNNLRFPNFPFFTCQFFYKGFGYTTHYAFLAFTWLSIKAFHAFATNFKLLPC